MRGTAGHALAAGIQVPCAVEHAVVEELVNALYEGSIELGPHNVMPLLHLADAMQVRARNGGGARVGRVRRTAVDGGGANLPCD